MKRIKEQNLYIPYNLCLKMKDLGFDWTTFNCYWEREKGTSGFGTRHEKVPKILYDQAFAWFREKGLEFNMGPYYDSFITERLGYYYEIVALEDECAGEDDCTFENGCREFTFIEEERFVTYEDAQSGVLTKLIEIYEEENSKKL